MNGHLSRSQFAAAGGVILTASALAACAGGCSLAFDKHSEQQRSLSAPGAVTHLRIEGQVGNISVTTDPGATGVAAKARMIGKAGTEARALEARNEITVDLVPVVGSPGEVAAKAVHPESGTTKQYQVDWEITVPEGVKVTARIDVGEVDLQGRYAEVDLQTDVGDISASRVEGPARASSDVGDVRLTVLESATLGSDTGDLKLTLLPGASGTFKASSDVGDITLCLPVNDKGMCEIAGGRIDGATDVGNVKFSLGSMAASSVKQTSVNYSGGTIDLVLAGDPARTGSTTITLRSDVGNISIIPAPGAAAAAPVPVER